MWKKVLKISYRIVGTIIGLMLIISALLIVFKDDIKDYALEEINKHLNKRVHIGYIDLAFWNTFPNVSLEFDDVLVYSKFEAQKTLDTALFAKKIRLKFEPLDFIKGNYNVHQIDLEDAVINMTVLEDGRINYDFLKPSDEDEPTKFEFSLEAINILNTRYSYKNKSTQQSYKLKINNMLFDGYFNEKQFTLNANADFWIDYIKNKSIALISNKNATCKIAVSVDQIKSEFEIKSADLKINQLPFLVKGKVTKDYLDFYIGAKNLALEKVANNFSTNELNVVKQYQGTGNVDVDVTIKGELATTKAPAIDAIININNGSIKDKDFSISNLQAKSVYTNGIATGKEKLSITSLSFNSLGSEFSGNFTVTNFDQPRIVGNANGWLNLGLVHQIFGPFNCSKLSGNIHINGRFDAQFNDPAFEPKNITIFDLRSNFELDNISAQLIGDNRLFYINKGELVIRNQKAVFKHVKLKINSSDLEIDGTFDHIADFFKQNKNLYIDAAVESNFLDMDDLSSDNKTIEQDWLLPSTINGKLNVSLNEVVYANHTYSEVNSRIVFGKKTIYFPYIKGKNAGSDIQGNMTISEEKPMTLKIKTTLSSPNIQFDQLFKEWNNFDQQVITADNIRGKANINLHFEGAFNLFTDEVYKNDFIAGISIKINDGALVNVGTFKEITESLKKSSTRLLLSKNNLEQLEQELLHLKFEDFENELSIKKGVLYIPKMELKSNALDLKLKGEHSFDNIIDYSFDFRFRELKGTKTQSEFGEIVDDDTGIRIYLKMFGDLYNPTFKWDKEAKKEARQEKIEQTKEEVKSVLKTGFGINKSDTTIKTYQKTEHPSEKLIMDFSNDSIRKDFEEKEKEKRKGMLQQKLDQWKEENKKETEKVEFEFD